MQLIDGKAISEQVKQEIAAEVAEIVANGGKRPHLAAILVGHDGGSETYVVAKVKACEVCGFKSSLIRYEADVTEEELLAKVRELNEDDDVDGFIVQPTVEFRTVYSELEVSKPIVYFDSPNRGMSGLWIKTNNYEAMYETCDLMVEKGYEYFVNITADPYVLTTRLERTRGLTDNLDLRKLGYDVIIANEETSDEALKEKLTPIFETKHNVCVVVSSCWLLPMVYRVLQQWKDRIPQDIGLVGFDSLEWTELSSPTVTTIVQPAFEEGYLAGKVLIDRIEGRNEELPNHILNCRINEKESTDKKKAL